VKEVSTSILLCWLGHLMDMLFRVDGPTRRGRSGRFRWRQSGLWTWNWPRFSADAEMIRRVIAQSETCSPVSTGQKMALNPRDRPRSWREKVIVLPAANGIGRECGRNEIKLIPVVVSGKRHGNVPMYPPLMGVHLVALRFRPVRSGIRRDRSNQSGSKNQSPGLIRVSMSACGGVALLKGADEGWRWDSIREIAAKIREVAQREGRDLTERDARISLRRHNAKRTIPKFLVA